MWAKSFKNFPILGKPEALGEIILVVIGISNELLIRDNTQFRRLFRA